ncbi:phage tail protein I [Pectobacterium brasiliense]|uniref:phage tail protein I n=1 Tax=Pectobacterium brasiliense TaxID=180957 RepID=UPI003016ABFE
MINSLLPVGSSELEIAAAKACAELSRTPIPLRQLCNPDLCPVNLLPYLAWAFSVDRWDEKWPEIIKRQAIKDAYFIHRHKGTIGALRRVVEPFGYLIRIIEWWQNGDKPGTFRLDIGVQDSGITEETFFELERLIADAKPASRHLLGLNINLDTQGAAYVAATVYGGDDLTVYPYFPEIISVSGLDVTGAGIHLIDSMSVTA